MAELTTDTAPGWSEIERLAVLARYDILDTPPEPAFDDIVALVKTICAVPIALVSLVAAERQWFKAKIGIEACETPIETSVCALAIRQTGLFIIPDLAIDPRTANNPLVTQEPRIRFYAGAPLITQEGVPLGSLCAIDREPRPQGLSPAQQAALAALGRQVMAQLDLRAAIGRRERALSVQDQAGTALRNLNRTLEITVEKRTQEHARIWGVSRDLLGVADRHGVWLSVNPAWTRVLGWTEEEFLGQTLDWLVPDDDRAADRAAPRDFATVEASLDFETRLRRRDGAYSTLVWTAVPVGEHLYCTGRDVTQERADQALLRTTEERLRQSQKMEAVGQLTGGLAHDFNNLLAVISGSLEMTGTRLRQGRIGDLERYVIAAAKAADRAAALTHRLLAFSRHQTLDPKPTDINRLVAGMEELIRRTVGPAITLEVVGAAGLWMARVDPNQLENALLNLCINARDAMPEGGRLTIETANKWIDDQGAVPRDMAEGQYLALCVTDTGIGMTPAVIARAFDPFFTTKPLGQGTGLGLSMVYGFAHQSGGQARIYSELGIGTTLCLYLPRHYGVGVPAADLPEAPASDRRNSGETILIVDDEPPIRMFVGDALQDIGYTTLEAADGAGALHILQSEARVDLLITDIGLPGGMTGRQLADTARLTRPQLKVVFITGYAANAVMNNGHLAPDMHVITKPFPIEQLVQRIQRLLQKG